jgi:Lrp/AsnC family leucine-responsive transcriptional regulator
MISFDELDDLDVRLLDALQRNARATFAELGSLVGLRAPAVHDRVKRLENRGYIRGYAARLDPKRLGLELAAFVSAYTTADVDYERFHAAVGALPEVAEIHSVAGDEAFVLKVVTRSTAHLDDFLTRLKAIPGIARTRTTIVLSTPFERGGFALGAGLAAVS